MGTHWQFEFRQHDSCQGVPIVVYTGSQAPGDHQEMMAMGAADCLQKARPTGPMPYIAGRMMVQLT